MKCDCIWSGPCREVFVLTLMAPPPSWSRTLTVAKTTSWLPKPLLAQFQSLYMFFFPNRVPMNLHGVVDKKQRYTWRQNATQKWITMKLLPPTPLSRSWLPAFWFCLKIERFFGSRPKAFKHIPSASDSDKRHGRFCAPFMFRFCCYAFSLPVALTKRGPSSRSWKHLSNADSLSSFSPSFCHLPVRFLFPPAGLLCVLCDVCPSPAGLYPLCAPKGPRACCCSLKRLGEKFGATL